MNAFYIFAFALLQPVITYRRAINLQRTSFRENAPELPQHTPNEYINFDHFDDSQRSERQLSQPNYPDNGFDWYSDVKSSNNFNSRRFNGFNWNRRDNNEQKDSFIFEDDFENRNFIRKTTQRIPTTKRRFTTQRIPTSTVAIPGMGTPRTPCEDRCLSTPEYNPVCGDDDMTYFSRHRLNCAQLCGKRVKLKHLGACSLIPPRG